MKIDIHAHTKKTKSGDPKSRNIDVEDFNEIIKTTDVSILAITNHNHFDLEQYKQFREVSKEHCHVWPGIELDILENGKSAHLIVIVNPNSAEEFAQQTEELLEGSTADNFTISLDTTVKRFDSLDAIYVAHYYAKKPDLTDDEIEILTGLVSDEKRVIKEATNSLSAGIYVSHGHRSIYGSDIQDWDNYHEEAKELPELRLPVESFDQFCLLLEKNESAIKTILNKKTNKNIPLSPFSPDEHIEIDIYNDINIIFGSKGTGKTEILKALSKYYSKRGTNTNVYESSNAHLVEAYDIKGKNLNIEIEDYKVDDCTDEIKFIKNAAATNITSLSRYRDYQDSQATNKIANKIRVNNLSHQDLDSFEMEYEEVSDVYKKLKGFYDYVVQNNVLDEVIDKELFRDLEDVMDNISSRLKEEVTARFIEFKSHYLFNHVIKVFVEEISKKTGQPEKPIETGFKNYASGRIEIEKNINIIVNSIKSKISPETECVGDLGNKGDLYCKTNLKIQDGEVIDGKYTPVSTVNKTPQKEVSRQFLDIQSSVYTNKLFEKVAELNEIENSEKITSIKDLLLYRKHFALNGNPYTPSNGESSMILLHNELSKDKEIYLIDEPEKSLGNDYISEVIVPLLKQLAKRGKTIVVATHDANIAVRTLPYNSIYRKHDVDGYFTYSGNPFSNTLVCQNQYKDDLDWKETSMKTLEGGKQAFGERGKIYGNT